MKLKSLLNEAAWPEGYFEVTNRFQISGGAWRMTFPKGQIIKVVNKGPLQYMFRWDPFKQDYVAKNPPFSGNEDGRFGLGAFQDRDAQSWVDALVKNSKRISKGQADTAAKNMAQEKTLKARAAIKMLQKMSGSQMVKITIVP